MALWSDDAGAIFAASDLGEVLTLDSNSWRSVAAKAPQELLDIAGGDSTVATSSRYVYRFDGENWLRDSGYEMLIQDEHQDREFLVSCDSLSTC